MNSRLPILLSWHHLAHVNGSYSVPGRGVGPRKEEVDEDDLQVGVSDVPVERTE